VNRRQQVYRSALHPRHRATRRETKGFHRRRTPSHENDR